MTYSTVAEVRNALRVPTGGDWPDTWDDALRSTIEEVDRMIDSLCDGPILAPAEAASRVFTATHPTILVVDFFTGEPTVERVGGGVVNGWHADGREKPDRGRQILIGRWVTGARYKVTTRWGHPAISVTIRGASREQSARLFQRRSSAPSGDPIFDQTDFALDEDIIERLGPWRPSLII